MIELYISSNINSHKQLKNRVEDNHIALRIVINNNNVDPKLIEGGKTYEGNKSINAFLDDFESFMTKWYECKCDDYNFD